MRIPSTIELVEGSVGLKNFSSVIFFPIQNEDSDVEDSKVCEKYEKH